MPHFWTLIFCRYIFSVWIVPDQGKACAVFTESSTGSNLLSVCCFVLCNSHPIQCSDFRQIAFTGVLKADYRSLCCSVGRISDIFNADNIGKIVGIGNGNMFPALNHYNVIVLTVSGQIGCYGYCSSVVCQGCACALNIAGELSPVNKPAVSISSSVFIEAGINSARTVINEVFICWRVCRVIQVAKDFIFTPKNKDRLIAVIPSPVCQITVNACQITHIGRNAHQCAV